MLLLNTIELGLSSVAPVPFLIFQTRRTYTLWTKKLKPLIKKFPVIWETLNPALDSTNEENKQKLIAEITSHIGHKAFIEKKTGKMASGYSDLEKLILLGAGGESLEIKVQAAIPRVLFPATFRVIRESLNVDDKTGAKIRDELTASRMAAIQNQLAKGISPDGFSTLEKSIFLLSIRRVWVL